MRVLPELKFGHPCFELYLSSSEKLELRPKLTEGERLKRGLSNDPLDGSEKASVWAERSGSMSREVCSVSRFGFSL